MTPLTLAAAIPSACRLRMNSHSFCATKDKICSTRSAMKVPIRSLPCRVSSSGIATLSASVCHASCWSADIYRADNIQRKQPQLHRQVRHSLQLLPQCTKRINTPRMIFTIIFPPPVPDGSAIRQVFYNVMYPPKERPPGFQPIALNTRTNLEFKFELTMSN